jgi:hypothetical protein
LELNLSHIKSLPFDFGGAVDAHIKALKAHQSTIGEAAPTPPHPLVERVIRRVQYPIDAKKPDDFVADFKVVDDTPSLDQRKMELAQKIGLGAQTLINSIIPPLKVRLWNLQANEAKGIPPAKRSTQQKTAIANQDARNAKVNAIMAHLAQMESDIDDLTEQTIDGWQPAPFPK